MEKSGISKSMGDFEKVFEDLDVQIAGTTGALDNVVGESAADSNAVSELLEQMQGEMGLQAQIGI